MVNVESLTKLYLVGQKTQESQDILQMLILRLQTDKILHQGAFYSMIMLDGLGHTILTTKQSLGTMMTWHQYVSTNQAVRAIIVYFV